MQDPLGKFRWETLYEDYDCLCERFDGNAPYLYSVLPSRKSDRALYHSIVRQFAAERRSAGITIGTFEAMLYWKLYSQPAAVSNICKRLRMDGALRAQTTRQLAAISTRLPSALPQQWEDVMKVVRSLNADAIYGMRSPDAFPVRTTFLHFVYPEVVPIFDKQVLYAVGVFDKNANHNSEILSCYLQHAWKLAKNYNSHLNFPDGETSLRLIDMALWVVRNRSTCKHPISN